MKDESPPDLTIDLAAVSDAELRSAIEELPLSNLDDFVGSASSDSASGGSASGGAASGGSASGGSSPGGSASGEQLLPPMVELHGLSGQHAACMRLRHPIRIHAKGNLGDFAFACCGGVDVHLEGNVGDGACEGVSGGRVRITGNAGCGLGAAMTGGTVAIYGSAGPRVGAAMRGGSIFVRGNAGDDTGAGALGGTIVVGGNAGSNLGDALNNVTVFLKGRAASLAPGVIEVPIRKREEVSLGLLLMNASIRGKPSDFRRVIPEARWRAEEAGAGEVRPNWR